MKFNLSAVLIWLLCAGSVSNAAILWAGGEDIDFPNGGTVSTDTTGGRFRSGYARHGIYVPSGIAKSNVFPGGAVTSFWLSFRQWSVGNSPGSVGMVGLGKLGTDNSLWLGTGNSAWNQLALWKYDGTTWTQLAMAPYATLPGGCCWSAALNDAPVVMQVINYGATATVNVYNSTNQSAAPLFTYTGNVTAGGATNLDSVFLRAEYRLIISEIIVSDVDPRSYSLVTMAPSAAGDVNQWTNTYTNVNPTAINDNNYVSESTSGEQFQCNLNNVPAGAFRVVGVKVAARGSTVAGGVASLSVGVKTNSTVNAPTAVTQSAAYSLTETYYSLNPITTSAWTTSEMDALQINLQAAP